jgi:hypothetical protein
MDVGVDAVTNSEGVKGYRPISLDEVIERLKDQEPVDHHNVR